MKLSEIRKMSEKIPNSLGDRDPSRLVQQIQALGLDPGNFYQELEMDSAYVDIHRDESYSNAHIQLHSHAFYELVCCTHSQGVEYVVGSNRYKLQTGDIIFVPPDLSHRPLLPEQVTEPYRRDVLWLSAEFINGLHKAGLCGDISTFQAPFLFRTAGTRWSYICDLFRAGVAEFEQKSPDWETIVFANAMAILAHLHRASLDLQAKPMTAEKPDLLDQVMAYVEQHLAEKITLADMARHFFISESTITQTFRKKMGVSFYRCVTQRRLISAKALIERGLPLESVAEQVGFSDYSAFFRAFKQEYGISPRQYRKMQSSSEPK